MLKKFITAVFVGLAGSPLVFGQFTTTGDATPTTCNCYQVTDDVADENGSFYHSTTINLNTAFNFKFTVNFGCETTGGEGLAFLLQSTPWTTGSGGFGIGYEGIAGNVLAVEFDTRDNDASGEVDNWDVPSDHISLQDNGDFNHEPLNPNNLLGDPSGLNAGETPTPHNIKPGFPNVEDCEDHLVEISWTPGANQTIQVKVDNITSMTYIGDMITDQFGGNPNVFWGWTGSTSSLTNTQTVCMALIPEFTYTPTNCPGEVITFTDASDAFYDITDWSWDFDGLGTSTAENPTFTFTDAGTYPVELSITDDEGCTQTATVDIPVGFDTDVTADDLSVCPDGTTILHAEGSPFEASECCFKLVLNDLWGDYWGSGIANEIEIIADGVTFGTYTPTSFDPGSGTSDTVNLCFDQGTELEFVIHGEDSPAECSYFFLSDDLTEILSVDGATPGAWFEGATETHTVDCGLVAPDYDYLWDNAVLLSDVTDPDPTATLPATTWFYVDITDPAIGCTITDSIEIATAPPVTATLSGTDQICAGDLGELTVTFTGTGPYELEVNGPSGPLPLITDIASSPYTLEVGEDGVYTLISVSGDGCPGTFSGTGTIDVIVPFDVDIEASATYCDGDPVADLVLVATGGGTVNWYDNPDLTPPAIGTGPTLTPGAGVGTTTYYAAETEGVLGCVGTADFVTITINPVPPAPGVTGDTEYCEGETATALTGEPSLSGTLTWYDGPLPGGITLSTDLAYTPAIAAPGLTLYLTETAEGCESEATVIDITVHPTPAPPAVTGDTEYCEGETATELTATVGSGGTIEWQTADGTLLETGTTHTPTLPVGSTTIHVYETLGDCASEPTIVTINVQAAPTVEVPEELRICTGDSIQVTAVNNGYSITWSDGQAGETVWLKPDLTTTYIVTATNPACGSSTDEITILVLDPPTITTSNDTVIGIGGEVNLWATTDVPATFTWNPSPLNCLTDNCDEIYDVPNQATVYVVTATDENGCQATDTVLVDINGYMEVFVPNVFSPNGDGSNDKLVIYGPRLFNFHLEIYDRWGKRVFITNEQKDSWDGTFNDQPLSTQTFVYILTGETVLGEKIKKEGNTTLIR